jgi:cytochrome c oxidase cbb3-type subunit 3
MGPGFRRDDGGVRKTGSALYRLPSALTRACTLAALLLLASACDREDRRYRESPPSATPTGVVRLSSLQPGPTLDSTHAANAYQENAYAISEGQRLFGWYNCSGCHANGGGGMGPPLIDDEWIYGDAPENVNETIVQGRPNGMPSFGARIPTPQVWQIVAYVRSLSGQTPSAARSSRSDHMMNAPGSQSLQKPAKPKSNSRPAAGEMP